MQRAINGCGRTNECNGTNESGKTTRGEREPTTCASGEKRLNLNPPTTPDTKHGLGVYVATSVGGGQHEHTRSHVVTAARESGPRGGFLINGAVRLYAV